MVDCGVVVAFAPPWPSLSPNGLACEARWRRVRATTVLDRAVHSFVSLSLLEAAPANTIDFINTPFPAPRRCLYFLRYLMVSSLSREISKREQATFGHK